MHLPLLTLLSSSSMGDGAHGPEERRDCGVFSALISAVSPNQKMLYLSFTLSLQMLIWAKQPLLSSPKTGEETLLALILWNPVKKGAGSASIQLRWHIFSISKMLQSGVKHEHELLVWLCSGFRNAFIYIVFLTWWLAQPCRGVRSHCLVWRYRSCSGAGWSSATYRNYLKTFPHDGWSLVSARRGTVQKQIVKINIGPLWLIQTQPRRNFNN